MICFVNQKGLKLLEIPVGNKYQHIVKNQSSCKL